jgi:hypothetical protein
VECGLIGEGKFVGSHGQAAPLLESGDAAFDGIALFVCLGVEAGRAASSAASPEAVSDLVGGLRDDGPDAASSEMRAGGTGGVGTVRENCGRSGSRSPEPGSRNPDPGHDSLEGRCVTGLASGDVQG